jgi:hypothetical protein
MRTIAIILGDNDFGNTMYPLLETVKRIVKWHEGTGDMTQERVKDLILNGLEFHYRAFQQRPGEKDNSSTFEYLRKNTRILFDAEAETDIQNQNHDSGAWYLELQSGVVTFY